MKLHYYAWGSFHKKNVLHRKTSFTALSQLDQKLCIFFGENIAKLRYTMCDCDSLSKKILTKSSKLFSSFYKDLT